MAAVGRGGSTRWHRLHDVALHRRAGVSRFTDFSAAKIAVFAASIFSAAVGTAVLWGALRQGLLKRRRRAPAGKYHSPPVFMPDREQEVLRSFYLPVRQ